MYTIKFKDVSSIFLERSFLRSERFVLWDPFSIVSSVITDSRIIKIRGQSVNKQVNLECAWGTPTIYQ